VGLPASAGQLSSRPLGCLIFRRLRLHHGGSMSAELERVLKSYADLVVKVAVNVQPGQRLLVCNPWSWGVSLDALPLVRQIATTAYEAGASFVDVLWGDEELRRMAFLCAPPETFKRLPAWHSDGVLEYFRRGDAVLILYAEDPDLLKDQDPAIVAMAEATLSSQLKPMMDYRSQKVTNCAVVSAPIPRWSARVFPHETPQVQEEKLWSAIFGACYLDCRDPLQSWREHIQDLGERSKYLTHKKFTALRFTSEVTDLTVGLADGHTWHCAGDVTQKGIPFVANLPTEEVYTLPHRERVEGVVRSTRPLSCGGVLIEDFTVMFRNGKVVSLAAAKNEEVLKRVLEADEGASRLGEVGLVPDSSAISQSGVLFFNTLYDENAASHLAFGRGWKSCIQGGGEMDDDAFIAHGGNESVDHVDFMIGSPDMDVDGLTAEGNREPLMRNGEWAFTP